MMPRLDGYQTCALIKNSQNYQNIPVIMLSSKDGLFDQAKGRVVGSDEYLTKPFSKDELLNAIQSCKFIISNLRAKEMARILIVDDSPTETFRFKEILTKHGYDVLEASNGADGVTLAKAEQPDLVLMDVVMPGVNGFQATRQITRDEDTKHIPVVIVSTKDQATDRVWGKRQGAIDYLIKPIEEKQLIDVIKQFLN